MEIIKKSIRSTLLYLLKTFQKFGCDILTWTGLNSICDLNIPDLLSLLSFPILKWGLETLSDLNWLPTEDDVSYVWLSCHLFLGSRSLGPFGIDHWGLFYVLLVFELFYGW